jgi:hypothetical protein
MAADSDTANSTPSSDAGNDSTPPGAKGSQRRASYRVAVGTTSDLTLSVWRITESAALDRVPSNVHLIAEQARDMSETGCCILLRTNAAKPIELKAGERVRVVLKYAKLECLIEGRVRLHPSAPRNADGSVSRTGVQFQTDKNSPAGRLSFANLGKIIAGLRREELRNQRLGLS